MRVSVIKTFLLSMTAESRVKFHRFRGVTCFLLSQRNERKIIRKESAAKKTLARCTQKYDRYFKVSQLTYSKTKSDKEHLGTTV